MMNKAEIQFEPLKRGDVVKTSNGTMGVVLEETEDKRAYYTVVFVSGTTPRMTYYTVREVERMKQGLYVIPSKNDGDPKIQAEEGHLGDRKERQFQWLGTFYPQSISLRNKTE